MLENLTPNLESSGIIAYIGAVTGTAVLVWNFARYFLDNRLKLVVHVIESYVGDDKTEIRAEIFNNGSSAVTIRKVFLEAYLNKSRKKRYGVAYELKDQAAAIPAKLDIGGILIAKIEMDARRMLELAKHGDLAIAVHHSRSHKPRLEFYDSMIF